MVSCLIFQHHGDGYETLTSNLLPFLLLTFLFLFLGKSVWQRSIMTSCLKNTVFQILVDTRKTRYTILNPIYVLCKTIILPFSVLI